MPPKSRPTPAKCAHCFVFTAAAAIGIVGVLVILTRGAAPAVHLATRSLPITAMQAPDHVHQPAGKMAISPEVRYRISRRLKGELLLQIDDRIYRQRVHQAEAQLAMVPPP